MNKIRIGVYSVKRKGKRTGEDVGYIRFRLKDDSSDPAPMNEASLDYYMTYIMDDLDLTLIEIYEIYTL